MLFGENLRRREPDGLRAVLDGAQRGKPRDHGFSRAHVALNQALHGLSRGEVLFNFAQHAALCSGQLKGQQLIIRSPAFHAAA